MERLWSTSHRAISVRSIFTFVLAVILAALLWATFSGSPAYAADATWSNETIIHSNHTYTKADSIDDTTGTIPQGATVYQSAPQGADSSTSQKVFILYFSPGVDPPTATSANYVEFNYSAGQGLSNAQNKKSVTLTPQGEETNEYSSCSVSGIGWIICPVSVFLAESMDGVFDILAGIIKVQPPILGDSNNSMFTAWNVMRSIANIAFVIVFLIIIYSQLTSVGLSNYGLKRLIPRLIIAAILVNLSFIVTALAIDVSNILGFSIQDIFNKIREDLFHMTNDDMNNSLATHTWVGITTTILAGAGTIAGISYAVSSGAIVMLLPLLIGLAFTLIFVVIVLAARQAIITILVIIAPLAFVAYLLPNTEKWFDKWRDLFMTMLIFFPAFSLVFGGSQLAGQIIIQNAGDNIIMLLFGMAVQIAPLVITPLLLKFSGSLLGRIAQIANDPRKGIMDRSKNWAGERRDLKRYSTVEKDLTGRSKFNPLLAPGRAVKANEFRKRRVQNKLDTAKIGADNAYHSTDKYAQLHEKNEVANFDKQVIDNKLAQHLEHEKVRVGSDLHIRNVHLEDSKMNLEVASTRSSRLIEEYKAGRSVGTSELGLDNVLSNMQENTSRLNAEKQGVQAAQFVQQKNIATLMTSETVAAKGLQRVAGGIDPNGIIRAQANAEANLERLEREALDNSVKLLNAQAINSNKTLKSYSADVLSTVMSGADHNFQPQVVDAALEAMAQDGNISILRKARMSENIDQQSLTKLFARNAATMKQKGGFDLQANPDLALATPERMNVSIANTIGDVTADNIAGVKAGFWGEIATNIDTITKNTYEYPDARERVAGINGLRKAYRNITEALVNDDIRASIGDRLDETIEIHKRLSREFSDGDNPVDYSKIQ